ncbi:HAD-IA family hydrolase [Solicola sp. PLA-1-18]|uniref:HAD-IA family hydrolase n=1 Tax=Solicola sp. PLA-1-18 TaxID=3380532 RepID=UPI003B7C2D0A
MTAAATPGEDDRTVIECDVVLFDLDGTLVDSTPVVDRIWSDLARRLGRRPEDVIGRFHGMQAGAALREVDPTLSDDEVDELRAWVIDEELRDLSGIRPIPGAPRLLEQLPVDAWGVVTSCPRGLALARLDAAALPVPAVMVTADDVADGKPHPAPFALGAALMGADPSRVLAVEDAPAGIASAQAAGCSVLGLLTTHRQLPIRAIDDLRHLRLDRVGDGLLLTIPGEVDDRRPR